MAVNIGPRIGIDGEAEFRKQISNLIQQQKTLASEMKAVTSAFDKNDKSQESLTAQAKVLNQQIQVQQQRVAKLQEGLSAAAKKFGEADTRTQKWQQSVNEATADLNRMKSQLSGLENNVDDVGNALEDASREAASFGDVLSANIIVEGAKAIASAVSDVVESTKEYRNIMGTLQTSSEKAGYSAEQTSESYYQLYWALGDTQAAATATANLQALKLDQEELNEILKLSVGAWATYGDSIPIDSLAESINETIRSGTVTGAFADVLNWGTQEGEKFGVAMKANTEANKEWNDSVAAAETAEDYFNLALQSASSEAERANIVMQAMASQGLGDTADAWYQNNKDIVNANNAQLEFTENMAALAEQISPAVTAVKDGFNEVLEAILEIAEGVDFSALADEIKSGFSYFTENILPEITDFIKFVLDNKETVVAGIAGIGTAFATWNVVAIVSGLVSEINKFKAANEGATTAQYFLNAAMSANPVGVVITVIAGLVAAITTLWLTNEDFRDAVINIGKEIVDFVSGIVSTIGDFFTKTIPDALSTVVEFTRNNWQGILQFLVNPFAGAFTLLYDNCEGFRNTVDTLAQNIKNAFSNMADGIKNTVGRIKDSIVNGIGAAVDWIKSLPGQALTWGMDMINGFADGIMSAMSGLLDRVRSVADSIRSYLHFSRPDVGPLRDYESWMPDMMMGMAEGIRANAWRLEDALNAATSYMGSSIATPTVNGIAAGGTSNISITINAPTGMDVNALADVVAYRLQTLTRQKEAVW